MTFEIMPIKRSQITRRMKSRRWGLIISSNVMATQKSLSHTFKIGDFEEELLNHEAMAHLKLAQIPIRKQC